MRIFIITIAVAAGVSFAVSHFEKQDFGSTVNVLPAFRFSGNSIVPRDTDADFGLGSSSTSSAPFSVDISGDNADLISSGSVTLRGLQNCDTIDSDASGVLSCGTDGGGGSGGGLASSSPWTTGDLVRVVDDGTVTSIATSSLGLDISDSTNLAVSATGLELSDDSIALSSGFGIPLTASTSNWETFFDTPSTRITAGDNLDWSGNTLNATDTDTTNSNIPFLTVGNTASLSLERDLTATSPLEFTDGGANGAYDLGLVSGFEIFRAASGSDWDAFEKTPSTVITAGTGLSWSTNTLNAEVEASDLHDAVTLAGHDYLTLSTQEITAGQIDLENHVSGTLTGSSVSFSDTLDFSDFKDAMTLDANLTIASAGFSTTWGGAFNFQGDDSIDFNASPINDVGNITFQTGATGGRLRTGTSNADKFILQGYDVDDGVYRNVIELDAGNTITASASLTNLSINQDHFTDLTGIGLTVSSGVLEADWNVIASLSDNETITGNWVNTANPWDISDETNLTAGTDLTLTDDDLTLDSTLTQAFTFSNTGSHSAAGEWNFDSDTLVIDSGTNNVGIGASSPDQTLDVEGSESGNTGVSVWTKNNDATGISDFVTINSDASAFNQFITFGDSYAGANRYGLSAAGSNEFSSKGRMILGTTDSTNLQFITNGTIRGTFLSGGNFGLGTANPSETLDVAGNASISGTTTLAGVTYTWPSTDGSNGQVLHTNGSGTLTWDDDDSGGSGTSGNNNELLTDDGSGGINSESNLRFDGSNFEVVGLASVSNTVHAANLRLDNDAGTNISAEAFHTYSGDATPRRVFSLLESGGVSSDGRLRLYDTESGQSSLAVNIDAGGVSYLNGGNVGIGTTSPTTKLDISGNASVSDTFEVGSGGLWADGTNVGIGTTAPTTTLDVAGNASVSGTFESSAMKTDSLRFSSGNLVIGSGDLTESSTITIDEANGVMAIGRGDTSTNNGVKITGTVNNDSTNTFGTSVGGVAESSGNGMGGSTYTNTVRPGADITQAFGTISRSIVDRATDDSTSYDIDFFRSYFNRIDTGSNYSGTVGTADNFFIADSITSTGTINNFNGLNVANLTRGSSINRAISISQNADENGSHGIYALGTAHHYFRGDAGFGTTGPAMQVHISSTSFDGNILRLQDSDGTCDHNPESGSEVVSCSSDESLKENIRDYTGALDYLESFDIREYEVKEGGNTRVGVIAQEVLKDNPGLVKAGKLSSVSEEILFVEQPNPWVLLRAIQELEAENEALEDRLTALEDRVAQLDGLEPPLGGVEEEGYGRHFVILGILAGAILWLIKK